MPRPSRRPTRAGHPFTLTAAVLAAGLLACETPIPLAVPGAEDGTASASAEVRTESAEIHLGPEGTSPEIYVDGKRVDADDLRALDTGTIERIEVVKREKSPGTVRITLKESPGT